MSLTFLPLGRSSVTQGQGTLGRMLVRQLQDSHATSIRLLFYTLRGKDCVNDDSRAGTDLAAPTAETVAVPFQILLVIFQHVLSYNAVLSFPAVKETMRSNESLFIEHLNVGDGNPYIGLSLDVLS